MPEGDLEMRLRWCFRCSLRRFFVKPENARLRGEVALLKRPRHGG